MAVLVTEFGTETGDSYDAAEDWVVEQGHLFLSGKGGDAVAAFAPGAWRKVAIVPVP